MIISPDTAEGGEEALQKYPVVLFLIKFPPHLSRVNLMITSLKEDGLEPRTLLENLQYVEEALTHLLFLQAE